MEDNDRKSSLTRRNVLKSTGLGVAGFVGVAGTGAAAEGGVTEDQAAQLEAPHDSVTDAAATVEEHAGGLLTTLSDAGILPAATVSDLGVDSLHPEEGHAEWREGLFSSVTMFGQPTSRVTLRKHVADEVVHVLVHPEAGEHYAIVHSKDSYDDATVVSSKDLDGNVQDGSVGTDAEYVGYSCEGRPYTDCEYHYLPWFRDGYDCYTPGSSGCCAQGYKAPPC